jgi:hypothetical protein
LKELKQEETQDSGIDDLEDQLVIIKSELASAKCRSTNLTATIANWEKEEKEAEEEAKNKENSAKNKARADSRADSRAASRAASKAQASATTSRVDEAELANDEDGEEEKNDDSTETEIATTTEQVSLMDRMDTALALASTSSDDDDDYLYA